MSTLWLLLKLIGRGSEKRRLDFDSSIAFVFVYSSGIAFHPDNKEKVHPWVLQERI